MGLSALAKEKTLGAEEETDPGRKKTAPAETDDLGEEGMGNAETLSRANPTLSRANPTISRANPTLGWPTRTTCAPEVPR